MYRKLNEWLHRPVAWGAVLLSYFGILAGVGYVAAGDWANDRQVNRLADEQRMAMVISGKVSVRNACNFDNIRAKELRSGLKLFLDDHHRLHVEVNQLRRREGLDELPRHRTNIDAIRKGINQISTRNCTIAESVITSNPDAPVVERDDAAEQHREK